MSPNDPITDLTRRIESQARLARQIAKMDPLAHYRQTMAMLETMQQRLTPAHDPFAKLHQAAADMARRERQSRLAFGSLEYTRHLNVMAAAAQAAKRQAQVEAQIARLSKGADAFDAALSRIKEQSAQWERSLRAAEPRWHDMPALYRQMTGSAVTVFGNSFERNLAVALRGSVPAMGADLATKLLAPTEAFGRYAPAALARADERDRAGDAGAHMVAAASVALAEGQVVASADFQEGWIEDEVAPGTGAAEEPTGEEERTTDGGGPPLSGSEVSGLLLLRAEGASERIERFFLVQEADVLAHAALLVDHTGRPLTQVVPTARRSERQLEFCRLVKACNLEARMHRPANAPPFGLGESLLGFCIEMGKIDGSSREGLGELVDGLYFTLYEATDKKRTLRPYLSDAECAVVDRVQNLRNRVFRHNRERERPEIVVLQAREVLADLRALGLDGEPHTPDERLTLHDRLLDEAIVLLETLLAAIRR